MMDLIPVVAIIANVIMIVMIVYFVTRSRQRRVEAQVAMQTRLIDRFSSATELAQFLDSPAGREFVTGVQGAATYATRERVMSGFNRSIILTSLGVAFLFLNFYVDEDFAVPAAIMFCLGVGYMVATYVSYKLSAKLMSDTVREP
jgi:peptidoglycan/LPS O-acetylase OafA/YrhL